MPSIYQLKPAFQNLLRPWVKSLYLIGVTANQVTLFSMLISIVLALFIYIHFQNHTPSLLLLLFPAWMCVRMGLNAVDGMLAREFGQQSNLGAFYNELCDVISDTALYLCLAALIFIYKPLLLLVTFLAILSEYTGVMAPLIGKDRRYDGPMGKSDRALCFGLLTTIIVICSYLNIHVEYLYYIANFFLAIMGFLLLFTIYNRIKNSLTIP